MSSGIEVLHAPAVVVGAGVAGLAAALGLGRAVVLADEAPGSGGSSPWAQGGMAAAVGSSDSAASHAADTVAAGAGLVDEAVASLVTGAGPDLVAWLDALGADLDRETNGSMSLHKEAAHSAHRIVHHRDATGAELTRALAVAVAAAQGVTVLSGHVAIDVLTSADPAGVRRSVGVLARRADGHLVAVLAPAVVIATGGYAHLWASTTTPPQAVGDGVAMAARAGVVLADLEFVQFHPTALDVDADPKPLLTEALRGQGALLVDETGARFVDEMEPRDVVARAIYRHLAEGHRCYLDARALADELEEQFPTVVALARRHGLDPSTDLLPVTPVTHYCMGGIATDSWGRTSLPGLWAAGEVASTGLHGANRLASNSLLEGMVMGRRAARDVLARNPQPLPETVYLPEGSVGVGDADPADVVGRVRRILWERAGVVRDEDGLIAARIELSSLASLAAGSRPGANALLVAELVVDTALARTESRGAHTRTDYPALDATQASRRRPRPEIAPTAAWRFAGHGARLVPAMVRVAA